MSRVISHSWLWGWLTDLQSCIIWHTIGWGEWCWEQERNWGRGRSGWEGCFMKEWQKLWGWLTDLQSCIIWPTTGWVEWCWERERNWGRGRSEWEGCFMKEWQMLWGWLTCLQSCIMAHHRVRRMVFGAREELGKGKEWVGGVFHERVYKHYGAG